MKVQEVDIKLNLKRNGIYTMGFSGATGKSYLYQLIKAYSAEDKGYLAITYNNMLSSEFLCELVNKFNGKLIILDRFDMYSNSDIIKAICNKSDMIILIDCKSNVTLRKLPAKIAEVRLEKDCIEVISLW